MKMRFKNTILAITAGLFLFTGILIVAKKLFHIRVPRVARAYFENYLTVKDSLLPEKVDALYILGGSAISTYHHIGKAATLFHSGKTVRILIFDSKAKWHFEPELGRNITRNELTIKMLVNRGIPKSCIDTIPVKEGFFGTLSEALALESYMQKRNYQSVILISSPCHSRRLVLSFEHYLKRVGVVMYIVPSEDVFSFGELILETVKVFVYKLIL